MCRVFFIPPMLPYLDGQMSHTTGTPITVTRKAHEASQPYSAPMCRNIKTLFNFDPPATPEEVQAAALQFVRKISGFSKPSQANQAAFLAAVAEIAGIANRLLRSLETTAPPKNREAEAAKAKAHAAERFGNQKLAKGRIAP